MLYAAHVVMRVVLIDEPQVNFPVWENVVLVESVNPEEAERVARQFGLDAEGTAEGSMTWEGKKAELVFAGIRRLTSCVDLTNYANLEGSEAKAGNGTEITYFQFTMKSRSDFDDFLAGQEVELKLKE